MRSACLLYLTLALALSGCSIVPINIPIVAQDPVWIDAGPVTHVGGRTIAVDGVNTKIAGLNLTDLSESERQEFETALSNLIRHQKVIVQPIGPGLSRLYIAGDPVYRPPFYQACVPSIPIFVPRIVAACPERIDIAIRMLHDGRASAAPDELADASSLPPAPGMWFRPEFPPRLGETRPYGPGEWHSRAIQQKYVGAGEHARIIRAQSTNQD